jgi:hypothetical protein
VIPSKTLFGFLHSQINKFCLGFEHLYKRDTVVRWEKSQLMIYFLPLMRRALFAEKGACAPRLAQAPPADWRAPCCPWRHPLLRKGGSCAPRKHVTPPPDWCKAFAKVFTLIAFPKLAFSA